MPAGREVAKRIIAFLVPCWCLVPLFLVSGLLFWAIIESDWPWRLLFIAGVFVMFAVFGHWGFDICRQCRVEREQNQEPADAA